MRRRSPIVPLALFAVLAAAVTIAAANRPAEAEGERREQSVAGPSADACLVGAAECNDTVDDGGAEDPQYTRATGEALLEHAETDLDASVRIFRRGAETFALTEDYVVGRLTVELDADIDGVYRVTKVTVETEDGPLVVTN